MIITECTLTGIKHLVEEYLQGLSSPFDSFLEEHILSSTFFLIRDNLEDVGYYAIHDNERLTQFYIRRSFQMHAQTLFSQTLECHSVKFLFVPTCDELFMSLVIDQDFALTKQAYFFQDSQVNVSESCIADGEVFRSADHGDLQQIQQVCGDFLHDYARWIAKGELFVYYRNNDLLGIGLIEKSKMFDGLASIGMFTNNAYRKLGIGKVIVEQLRTWCNRNRIKPICGCWYYNEASKRTLESGGMVTKTRLLHIEVTKQ